MLALISQIHSIREAILKVDDSGDSNVLLCKLKPIFMSVLSDLNNDDDDESPFALSETNPLGLSSNLNASELFDEIITKLKPEND